MASAHRERLTVAAVLALAAAVVFACFAPGRLNPDTVFQINEVGSGEFTNQHAAVLQALWKPFYDLGAGPGAVLLAQILTFLAGGYLVLRVAFGRIPSALGVAAIAFFPPVFLMLGTVMRDTWFTALLVLTAGLAARAVAAEPRTPPSLAARGRLGGMADAGRAPERGAGARSDRDRPRVRAVARRSLEGRGGSRRRAPPASSPWRRCSDPR